MPFTELKDCQKYGRAQKVAKQPSPKKVPVKAPVAPAPPEKPSIISLLKNDNIKRLILSFLNGHISQKPSVENFVVAMQNKNIQKLVLAANTRLSDFSIDHGLNSIVSIFYQKHQLLGTEEEPTLQ